MKSIEVTNYINKYDPDKRQRLEGIREIIHETIPSIQEKLWTSVPCFYNEEKMILIRVFGKHINLVADTINQHKDEFEGYKITPKGMLQILDIQEVPEAGIRTFVKDCGNNIK